MGVLGLFWGKDKREMSESQERRFGRFYYGWIIVGVALVSMAFWFGIRSTFSVFYVVLLEDFSWSRGETAGVQSVALITYTVIAPLVGGLIDRLGPRRTIIPGILLLALGLILCASLETLAQFYFLYGGLVATGVTCIAIVSYTVILSHWFQTKRGTANGVAVSGIGLGTFLLVPLSQYFISLWGWRLAFVMLGALVLVFLLPLNALLLRHRPQEMGLFPDGVSAGVASDGEGLEVVDSHRSDTDWTLQRAFRTGRFWALMIFPCLSVVAVYIVLVHHLRFLVDKGIDKTTGAFIFGLLGIISSVFRIFWGWLSDRIGRETTYTIGTTSISLGIGSLLLMEITGKAGFVFPFIIFFGAGWGVTAPTFMSVAADLFQGRGFGLIYGILEAAIGIGGAFGAWVAGFIFDRTGSYQGAFCLAVSVTLASCLFVWLAAPRKVRPIGQMRLIARRLQQPVEKM
jgi:MFS family permease